MSVIDNAAHRKAHDIWIKAVMLRDKEGNFISLPEEVLKQITLLVIEEAKALKENGYVNTKFLDEMHKFISTEYI